MSFLWGSEPARTLVGVLVFGTMVLAAALCAGGAFAAEAQPGSPAGFEIWPGLRMEFVWIPAGSFVMGSREPERKQRPDEVPLHEVRITRGFWLGRYEVTQRQWEAVMGENPSRFSDCEPECPVERVSWEDCRAFIDKLNARAGSMLYRLPTEAEWEYACRAGTTTRFSNGDSCLSADEANYDGHYPIAGCPRGPYRKRPLPVGSFAPNPWGLFDMHGNVAEWCLDWYAEDYYSRSPREDPEGPEAGRFRCVRGGAWYSYANMCRSAARDWCAPERRHENLGFRLLRIEP